MTASTHIIGGYLFAGTLCSFTDVNVFENPYYIGACALFSILPDIDTTQSTIGKICYPVAWIINRKFGHRTLTHSLLFLFFVWGVFFALFKFGVIPNADLVKIAIFAVLSHLVLDMITVSGVPLFYPFFKNPCVIPGNVNFRFKSGEWKSEMIISSICAVLCFSMQPLFAHGFWTSYNRQFATIKHVDRENRNTEFYVICEYSYILNAETVAGEAIVIDSNQDELTLFDRQNIFKLNSSNPQLKVNYTRPRISTIEKRFENLNFFNIPYDSLQNLLNGKLASGLIQSNKNVRYIENSVTYHTNFIKFSNRFDFQIYANVDSSRSTVRATIARLEATIAQSRQRHQTDLSRWQQHNDRQAALLDSLRSDNLTNYERNVLQRELIRLRSRNIEEPVYTPPSAQIAELAHLKKSLTENHLLFSGHLTVFTFGFDYSSAHHQLAAEPKPIYNPLSLFASANAASPSHASTSPIP
jgi:inner membrane protein